MLRRLLRLLKDARLYLRFPHSSYSWFRSVFATFEEVISAAPKTKPIGFDKPRLAQEYRMTLDKQARQCDYPALFWLKSMIAPGARVFDLVGNVGIHIYPYETYLEEPPDIRWKVCDVPAIAGTGEVPARVEGRQELAFTTQLEEANVAQIFVASGSSRYIHFYSDFLSSLPVKFGHLLLHRLPLYNGEPFATLHNVGPVSYPQYVFNNDEFIGSITRSGYKLVDVWNNQIDSCIIHFRPSRSLPHYYGCLPRFKREA